jgi:hypothetical protein
MVALRLAIAMLLAGVTAAAQSRPDFSGSWSLDIAASDGVNDDEREHGVSLRVRQTEREVVFERQLGGGPIRVIRYALDGTEAPSKAGSVQVKARSRWDGDRLITTGTHPGLDVCARRYAHPPAAGVPPRVLIAGRHLRYGRALITVATSAVSVNSRHTTAATM